MSAETMCEIQIAGMRIVGEPSALRAVLWGISTESITIVVFTPEEKTAHLTGSPVMLRKLLGI